MNADQFNAENPIGTPVRYFPIKGVGESIATKTRSEAWALGHGAVVVKIEGRAGCVCISQLEILDRPDYDTYLKQFQTAEDAAWSAWKEVQTLSARVAELEGAIRNALNAPNHIEADSILFEAIKP